jgi:predicted RNase H-like nuclease (RuvC/YqgF family)
VRRRRRRSSRRGTTASSDSFDLFLDALCNALGVVMFIMLMIVIFTQSAGTSDAVMDAKSMEEAIESADAQARASEAQLQEVLQAIAALPPRGDPQLLEQWRVGQAQLARTAEQLRSAGDALAAQRKELSASMAALAVVRRTMTSTQQEIKELELARARRTEPRQFIRLAKLRPDVRPQTVQLLCADGRLCSANFTDRLQRISEPKGQGELVNNAAQAKEAMLRYLAGKDPTKVRVEIAVWPSGFGAYKLLEPELIAGRFAFNPIPVATGQTIGEEGPYRGVQ